MAAIVLDYRDGGGRVAPDPPATRTWYGAARPLAPRSWSHSAADALASAVTKPVTPRRPYVDEPGTVYERREPTSGSRGAARRRSAFARNTTTRAIFFDVLQAVVDEARARRAPATASSR